MKNKIILFLLLTISLGACRTLQMQDYNSNKAIPERLPKLEMLVHEPSFLDAYDEIYLRRRAFDDNDYWYGYQITDRATDDAFLLFQRDLENNLVTTSGETYGHVRFKLLNYSRPWRGIGWVVPSAGTLFVANFLGMPFAKIRVKLDLQVEITNAQGKVLVQYSAPGAGKTTQALYYGYSASDAVRRSNLIALKDAMGKIKGAMAADVPMLASRLLSAGPTGK